MQTIRYVGKSDVRRITSAQWLSVGITSPDTEWNKANSYTASIDDLAAAFCLAQGDFVAGTSTTKFGKIFDRKFVDVPLGFGDVNWDTKKLLAGSQRVFIDWWSHSIGSRGSGITPDTPANRYTLSMPGLVKSAVQALYGDGGSGYLSHEYATATGTWTAEPPTLFGGGVRATAAATLSFAQCVGTTHKIFHLNAGITGSFRYRVDGGSYTTVTPPTGFSLDPGGVTITTSDGTHTIDVEWVSGQVVICGIQSYRASGIVLNRLGRSGQAASNYAINAILRNRIMGTTNGNTALTCVSPGWFTKDMEGLYVVGNGIPLGATISSVTTATAAVLSSNATATGNQTVDICSTDPRGANGAANIIEPFLAEGLTRADLVIIQLCANDPSNLLWNVDTVRGGIAKLLNPYMSGNAVGYSPDVIIVADHIGNWFDTARRYNDYVSALGALAKAHNAAFIDLWGLGKRSFKYWNDLGYFADNIHLSNAGCVVAAQPIIDILTQ